MKQGVLLICFGKRGYYRAAYNFAFSIKHHNPEIKIALFNDGNINNYLPHTFMRDVFDYMIDIPQEILFHSGHIDPGYIKMRAIEFSPFENTLQMDVECQALKDISEIFDELNKEEGFYYTHIIGEHNITQGNVIPSMYWAFANDIWDHFNLAKDAVLPSSNSSFQYWKKCSEADVLHKKILDNYDYPIPIDKLRNVWGGTQPDELYINVSLAQMKLTGKPPRPYLWMGNSRTNIRQKEIIDSYPLLCFFGVPGQSKPYYKRWYDENLIKWQAKYGRSHIYKIDIDINKDKHASNTKFKTEGQNQYSYQVIPEMVHREKIHLIVSSFKPKDEIRQKELITVLNNNIACSEINRITVVSENDIDTGKDNDRVKFVKLKERATFEDCIKIVNETVTSDTISIIANADIYFDNNNLRLIKELNYIDTAYALSRWNVDSNCKSKHFNYEWSQDCWIFKGIIPQMDCNFHFGLPACDNRFAFEMKKKYRRIGNPSFTIKSYHLHLSSIKAYTEKDRLPGDVLPVYPQTIETFRKKRMLIIQHGKVGDILICLPIAKYYSPEYIIDWLCPQQYHPLFEYVDYVRAVDHEKTKYDRVIDLSFGQGGSPEGWWQKEKHRFHSFVDAKYELAGVPVIERNKLEYHRDIEKENRLMSLINNKIKGVEYAVVHRRSDYGTIPKIQTSLPVVEFEKIEDYSIFDWRTTLENASEIHCIDSSLCNFVDVLPVLDGIDKYYYRTDRVPEQYDKTRLNNTWNVVDCINKTNPVICV